MKLAKLQSFYRHIADMTASRGQPRREAFYAKKIAALQVKTGLKLFNDEYLDFVINDK